MEGKTLSDEERAIYNASYARIDIGCDTDDMAEEVKNSAFPPEC